MNRELAAAIYAASQGTLAPAEAVSRAEMFDDYIESQEVNERMAAVARARAGVGLSTQPRTVDSTLAGPPEKLQDIVELPPSQPKTKEYPAARKAKNK